ncbi:hypothetical protein BDN71DRAFT_1513266 [Pleurotus eryngii]|uniref:HMG box domain-containing protein n=1 Tax=Pleurotus eryngii TaxID=5323 RepID=A0A9P5ZJ70_PLEER|nr:hypothetical protein BDN71DRAFT_1513266 [Pleurotus eryngii]
MPAERTRGSRRSDADGSQLVWTLPMIEPAPATGITFATNITPGTFNDPPPLVDAPPFHYGEAILFPPPEEANAARRSGHTKKKPENHIPRPPNAFILFRSSFIKSQHVSTEVETNHSTLSKIIGLTWQNLPDEERQVWHAKAKAALDEHKRKFPQYTFKPLHSKSKGGSEKRKLREVGPKDLKRCAKIAELLVEGKKGHELDVAIQEFDKTHVPEVITRFEAPITAKAYRRSSSAPIPESTEPQPFLSSSPTLKRKSRAASTQPSRNPSPSPAPSVQTPSLRAATITQPCNSAQFFGEDFGSFGFPPREDSPFDFNTFSFENSCSPLPAFECDPLVPPPCSAPAGLHMFTLPPLDSSPASTGSSGKGRGLSIDMSFLSCWAAPATPSCPSPSFSASSNECSTPGTPSFDCDSPAYMPSTPHYSGNTQLNLDMFDPPKLSKSFDEHSLTKSLEAFHEHQQTGASFMTFEQCNPTYGYDQVIDFGYTSFDSVPQYTV